MKDRLAGGDGKGKNGKFSLRTRILLMVLVPLVVFAVVVCVYG